MSDLTVGIDIGTTSVKAVAVDADGTVHARARVPHTLLVSAGDRFAHDAVAAWVDGPRRAFAALGDLAPAGVGIAAMAPAVAAVDAAGVPVSEGLLYGDGRGRNGSPQREPVGSGEAEAFLRWALRRHPTAGGYWPPQAVAAVALGAEPVVGLGVGASHYPLYDGRGWDAKRLAEIGVREDQLPRVVTETGAYAGRLGRAALAAGEVDGMAEQVVSGTQDPGDVLVMCGTTLMTWTAVAGYRRVEGLWTIPDQGTDLFLVGGPSNAGGLFLGWADRVLAGSEEPVDPGQVPVWLPYIRGERTPLHDPDRRALLTGLGLTHGPAALRRAAYEAAGFVVRHHVDLAGEPVRRIRAVGGGVCDPRWMQALADCTGLAVECAAEPEGAALGMAWLARMAAGLETSVADARRWVRTGRVVDPDPRWVGPCAERYQRFRAASDRPDVFR